MFVLVFMLSKISSSPETVTFALSPWGRRHEISHEYACHDLELSMSEANANTEKEGKDRKTKEREGRRRKEREEYERKKKSVGEKMGEEER